MLDFKSSLVISWSGMRGIVSLAIAIGLPATLADGSPFPQRNAIIFILVVVVATVYADWAGANFAMDCKEAD